MCDEGGGYEEECGEEGEGDGRESGVVGSCGSCGGFGFGVIGLFRLWMENKKGK